MFVADSSVWKGKPLLTFKFRGKRPSEEGEGDVCGRGRSAVLCGGGSENVDELLFKLLRETLFTSVCQSYPVSRPHDFRACYKSNCHGFSTAKLLNPIPKKLFKKRSKSVWSL